MATKSKIKGICKGIKYNISQIFVVKEREIEIGHPTDVKHVAHIGWDGQSSSGSGSAPSWMSDFKPGPDFSVNGNIGEPRDSTSTALSTWSSQDFDQSSTGRRTPPNIFQDFPPTDMPNIPKKHKRKKTKPTSSEKDSASSARPSRASKSKASTSQIAVDTTA